MSALKTIAARDLALMHPLYAEGHKDTVTHWSVPKAVSLAIAKDLESLPEAVGSRVVAYCEEAGGKVRLATGVVDKAGVWCGRIYNDIRPCPPFCD